MATQQLPKDLNGEIARTADSLDLSIGPSGILYPTNFGILKSLGANMDTFDGILTDTQVQSSLSDRRLALISKDWTVEPGGESPKDRAAAEWMDETLKALRWDDITEKMHYGIFYGFSAAELIYKRDGSFVAVDAVKVRKRNRFRFDVDGGLHLLTRRNVVDGELMPPHKFWHFATGGDHHDNPYGVGIAHWLYWPTFFKTRGIRFWLIFLDKFAMPTAVAKHSYGQDQTKINQLIDALKAIHTDSGIAIPKDEVEVELLEAARSGTSDYETLCQYMDKAISKVVVGQVASSEGTPGRLGNENLQADVRDDLIAADADLICESWNRGPGKWLTEWNFPGAMPPRVYRMVEPEEDLNARAERDERLAGIGFKPTLDYVTATYGDGYEAKEPAQPNPTFPPKTPPAQFTEPRILPPEDALDRALTLFLEDENELNAQMAQIIDPVFALIRREGPVAALGELTALYPKISVERFTETLARVQFISEIVGRISAESR